MVGDADDPELGDATDLTTPKKHLGLGQLTRASNMNSMMFESTDSQVTISNSFKTASNSCKQLKPFKQLHDFLG
jgi:hypothetical protein